MSDDEGETVIERRCPVCGWTGDDETLCPDCDYGTVAFEVTVHE